MRGAALLWLLLSLAAGCPQPAPPRDPAHLPLVTSDDPRAEAELREARLLAEQGNPELALVRYEAFIEMRSDDPLAPVARLELGRIYLERGDVAASRQQFSHVAEHSDPSLAERGRFYLGIAMHQAGEHPAAVVTLRPFVDRTIDPEETSMLLQALAVSLDRNGQTDEALVVFDKLIAAPVPDAHRQQAQKLAEEIVAQRMTPSQLERAFDVLPHDGALWPLVARRAVREADADGKLTRAREILEAMEAAGIKLDESLQEIALRAVRPQQADPRVIGAILTLSGRGRNLGELTLRGLMLAAGLPQGPAAPDAPRLVFRDDGADVGRAVQAVEELVMLHRAVAIVGPFHGRTAAAAARRAQELGVPILTMVPTPEITQIGDMVFRMFPAPSDEAQALVAAARARGATRFATLHPETPFGEMFSDAFAQAVAQQGGKLVATARYPAEATSFGSSIAQLRHQPFDALFVADASDRIALIAPALAAAGFWSSSASQDEVPRGMQPTSLLFPSVGFDPGLARSAGRYLQGGSFAVSFDGEVGASGHSDFTARFVAEFGARPNAFAAFAHDAYRLLRRAIDSGGQTRAALALQLLRTHTPDAVSPMSGFGETRAPRRAVDVVELQGDAFVRAP